MRGNSLSEGQRKCVACGKVLPELEWCKCKGLPPPKKLPGHNFYVCVYVVDRVGKQPVTWHENRQDALAVATSIRANGVTLAAADGLSGEAYPAHSVVKTAVEEEYQGKACNTTVPWLGEPTGGFGSKGKKK